MIGSRNKTSETYNEFIADDIYGKILNEYYPTFLGFQTTWEQKEAVNKKSYCNMTDTGLTKENTVKMQSIFKPHEKVKKVILYGLRAMSTFKPASDIDLTLIGKQINLTQLNEIENQLDDLYLPYKIDLSIFDQIENPDFLNYIKRVGQEFYNSNLNPSLRN